MDPCLEALLTAQRSAPENRLGYSAAQRSFEISSARLNFKDDCEVSYINNYFSENQWLLARSSL